MPLSGANSYEAEHFPPVSAKPSVGNFYVSPEINFPNCATESHGLVSPRTRGLPDILLSMKNPGADPGIGGNVSGVWGYAAKYIQARIRFCPWQLAKQTGLSTRKKAQRIEIRA